MPPKTVPCLICNLMVPKSQTVARADGNRICRSHPGAEEMAQKLREEDQQRRAKEVAKPRKHLGGYRPTDLERVQHYNKVTQDMNAFREKMYTHCWTCSQEGITLREHFAQCMIAQKRLQLRGEWNFLSLPEDMAALMGHPRVLACIPYDEQKDRTIYRAITNRHIKDILFVLRFVNMCIECIDKHKVRDRLEALMPKPTWEQLEAIMPAVIAIDPLLEALAEKKENQS